MKHVLERLLIWVARLILVAGVIAVIAMTGFFAYTLWTGDDLPGPHRFYGAACAGLAILIAWGAGSIAIEMIRDREW